MSKRHRVTVPRWTWIEGPSLSTVDSEEGREAEVLRLYKIKMLGSPPERMGAKDVWAIAIEPVTAINTVLDVVAAEQRRLWEQTPEAMRSPTFEPIDIEVIGVELVPGRVVVCQ